MRNNNLSQLQKFTAAFLVLLMAHWVLLVLFPEGMQRSIFFREGQDFMADFFNPLRYIADRNPYFTESYTEKIYLPFAYMLLFPFTRFDNYASMTLADCWRSIPSLISMVFFTLISCFMFYFSLKALCEKYKASKLILVPLLFSGFFIRTVERGNLILISASCSMFFLAFYDSENKFLRRVAVVLLAVSAVLKIYPALFGILYAKKRMYREFFSAVLLSVLLGLLPFLFFEHGFENIPRLLSNLASNSEAYGSIFRDIGPMFGMNHHFFYIMLISRVSDSEVMVDISIWAGLIVKILAAFSLIAALFIKDEYYSLVLCALGIIFMPAGSGSYCAIYLFPAIIKFFSLEKRSKLSLHYLFYLLYLSPFQFILSIYGAPFNNWRVTAYMTLIFMLICLCSAVISKPEKSF